MGRENFSATTEVKENARRSTRVEIIMTCERRDISLVDEETICRREVELIKVKVSFEKDTSVNFQVRLLPGDHDSCVGGYKLKNAARVNSDSAIRLSLEM
jgi:hypothetical protein